MKKALLLSFPYASAMGGGERYTEMMVRGLEERGWSFTLVSSSSALHEVFRKNGWPRHEVRLGPEPVAKWSVAAFPFTSLFSALALFGILLWFRFAKGVRTVLCLSLTDKLLATGFARSLGMRVVWMEHLIPGRSIAMNPFRPVYLSRSRNADVVTVSNAAKRGLVELGVSESRVTVIPPATWLPPKPPGPYEEPVIGCVSRLHEEKNVQMLLDAFTEVQREVPDARLEICGDGPEREQLEAVVRERKQEDRVAFRGWTETRDGVYGRYRVLAVPSKKESFGMAALEAEAHGVPVVATKVGGLCESVAHQVTGLLVPSGDAEAMARALVRLLRDMDLAKKFGKQGRVLAERLHTEKHLVDAWASLLKSSPSTR